jgi:beta-galactosidase/beta-glucuronidase
LSYTFCTWIPTTLGLIRSARLVATDASAFIAPFGISSPSFAQGAIKANGAAHSDGLVADKAMITPAVSTSGTAGNIAATFTIVAADGVTVVGTGKGNGKGGDTIVCGAGVTIPSAQLWSVARPYLYTLMVTVSSNGKITDTANETIGIRNTAWDGERGLLLNEEPVKMRGACNHESFTGVGAALPDRIDLLRVQQMRGVGMNAWRTSHNPPEPVLLDIADRLGVMVLDENRGEQAPSATIAADLYKY